MQYGWVLALLLHLEGRELYRELYNEDLVGLFVVWFLVFVCLFLIE